MTTARGTQHGRPTAKPEPATVTDWSREAEAEVVWRHLESQSGFNEDLRQAEADLAAGKGIPYSTTRVTDIEREPEECQWCDGDVVPGHVCWGLARMLATDTPIVESRASRLDCAGVIAGCAMLAAVVLVLAWVGAMVAVLMWP